MQRKSEEILQKRAFLHEMSWVEVKEVPGENTIAIIPTGSIEQHGPHLPIGTDSYIVYDLCERLNKSLRGKVSFVIVPPVVFGASSHHIEFPGTLSISTETYIGLIYDLCNCLIHHGFRKILVLNAHGGNTDPLNIAIRKIRDQRKILIAITSYWTIAKEEIASIRKSAPGGIAHGGELETSCMLVIEPQLVNKALIERRVPEWKTSYIFMDFVREGKVSLAQHLCDFTVTGVVGDPTLASQEKGENFLGAITDTLSKFIIEFSTWELTMMTKEN